MLISFLLNLMTPPLPSDLPASLACLLSVVLKSSNKQTVVKLATNGGRVPTNRGRQWAGELLYTCSRMGSKPRGRKLKESGALSPIKLGEAEEIEVIAGAISVLWRCRQAL
jgi:hypothetical protein